MTTHKGLLGGGHLQTGDMSLAREYSVLHMGERGHRIYAQYILCALNFLITECERNKGHAIEGGQGCVSGANMTGSDVKLNIADPEGVISRICPPFAVLSWEIEEE